MDYIIAFDKDNHNLDSDGTVAKSKVIYIPAGYTALLSLFNMQHIVNLAATESGTALTSDSCLTLKKLSFGSVNEQDIKLICGVRTNVNQELEKLLAGRRKFSEAIYQNCCAWNINPGNNFVLIPTPGFYELETEDLDQLDTIYVEYAILTAEQSSIIPNEFKLGG